MTSRREFIETTVKGIAGLTLVGVFVPLYGCTSPEYSDCIACDVACDTPNCDIADCEGHKKDFKEAGKEKTDKDSANSKLAENKLLK